MNYISHENNVKFIDGILDHSQEWKWLFDYLDDNYYINEPISWKMFLKECRVNRDLLSRFIKILSVCENDWTAKNQMINEIWILAKYWIGMVDEEYCISVLNSANSKLFFVCLYITKLINLGNESDYDFEIGVLIKRNYFQIVDITEVRKNVEFLKNLLQGTKVDGIGNACTILIDNVEHNTFEASKKFFEDMTDISWNYDAFSYKNGFDIEGLTWQEEMVYILLSSDLSVENEEGKIFGYDRETVVKAKKLFEEENTKIIIDTILFYSFGDDPDEQCVLRHCFVLGKAIDKDVDLFDILNSSSGLFVSKLMEKRCTGAWTRSEEYVDMLKKLQKYEKPENIGMLRKYRIPISKNQEDKYRAYCKTKYMYVDEMQVEFELARYLEDEDVVIEIDDKYYQILSAKFDEAISMNPQNMRVANLFYKYMMFLLKANKKNCHIDKRKIYSEMLRVKKMWTVTYYRKILSEMQCFEYSCSIPTEQVDNFNEELLNYPLLVTNSCMRIGFENILEHIKNASRNVFSMMFNTMEISPEFPVLGDTIIYNRHDVDGKILEMITATLEKNAYKLRNQFAPEKYHASMYHDYMRQIKMYVSMFHTEEKLYGLISEESPIDLLTYSNDVSLAMVTQLFPLLEMYIRDFASLIGIFPYKLDENKFMEANDPSSLLRDVLMMIYNEQESFENVSDIMFVYNAMYNSNFFNIRNECVHGRGYLDNGGLKFAFKTTLLCIHMIKFRIKTIENNVSDLTCSDEN